MEIRTLAGRRLTTAVFDLDDTLYPRATGVMERVGERIQRYMVDRLRFDPVQVEVLRRHYYQTYGTALRGLQVEHAEQIDAEDYLTYVHDLALEEILQSVPELDRALAAIALDKVIFTNATHEHAERVLELLGIREHFSRVVDLRSFGYYCKPDPRAYERLLALIDQPAEACIYVEDAPHNLRPAAELGMLTVLVDPHGCGESDFDYCIQDILQIGEVFAGLLGDPQTEPRDAR